MNTLAIPTSFALPRDGDVVPEAFWRSLGYFNLSRGLLAGLLLAGIHLYADSRLFGANDPATFQRVCIAYLAAATGFWWGMRRLRTMFRVHLAVHAITDLVAITLLLHASGGIRSGLGILLLMPLAAAASLSGGRNSLFYAALATFALFVENTYWVLQYEIGWTDYFPVGLLSAGCFTVALVTNRLAKRLIANETLVRQRSADLRNQIEINRLVIRDMPNGVLVVDAAGTVRQANPEAERLLGRRGLAGCKLAEAAPGLEALAQRWRAAGGAARAQIQAAGHDVYVRPLNPAGGAEDELLLFLEDAGKLKVQAQQVKLAALGRLTANIAHEIRNPLSAISHAAELLAEEETRAGSRDRLTRIIGDNAARLDRIVQEVLQLNRRDRAVREDVPVASFVRAFVDQFCQTGRVPPAAFTLRTPSSIHASFDRQHLHRILWNLVGNAWRHSRQRDGSVQIELRRNDEDLIELHVVDDGGDVAAEQVGNLFEPFFTTDSRGTGLGLYIARELAEANRAALDYVPPAERPRRDPPRGGADFRLVMEPHE